MRKRDNELVEQILDLADEHFCQEGDIANLQTSVAEKWAEAESNARASGEPYILESVRWAIRRVLFRPNIWQDVNAQQGAVRRAALETALVLCKG